MNLNLYDHDMQRIAIIGGQYVSCAWSEGYNSIQPFSLELVATPEYLAKVKPDCYVGRDDRKTMMIIKTVVTNGGKITASGHQAAKCLDDVAYIGTIPEGANIANAIRQAYGASSGYPGFRVAASSITETAGSQISNKSIAELCTKLCGDANIGYRVIRDAGQLVLEFYKPADRGIILAEKYGSLKLDSLTQSTSKFKNVAIVLGAGEGPDRVTVTVDQSAGGTRRELIVDARDVQQEDGESAAAYRARLAARGWEKLLEQAQTLDCAVSPLPGAFGVDYDLGDVITCLLPEHGLRLTARVVRFTENSKNNAASISVEIGSITVMR